MKFQLFRSPGSSTRYSARLALFALLLAAGCVHQRIAKQVVDDNGHAPGGATAWGYYYISSDRHGKNWMPATHKMVYLYDLSLGQFPYYSVLHRYSALTDKDGKWLVKNIPCSQISSFLADCNESPQGGIKRREALHLREGETKQFPYLLRRPQDVQD